jgi:hypothetical protein
MTTAADLVGSWRLERWQTRYDDGRVIHPMGADAQGLLIYAADGYMAAVLYRNARPPFTTGEALTAGIEEKIGGWDSYFSYAGRYDVVGDTVRHHVEASQYPNWVGTTQIRVIACRGDQLSLTTLPQTTRRGVQTSELRWRRTRPAAR